MSEETGSDSRCDLCDATFGSEQNRTAHFSGRKHREKAEKAIAELESRRNRVAAQVAGLEKQVQPLREEIDSVQETLASVNEEIKTAEEKRQAVISAIAQKQRQLEKIDSDISGKSADVAKVDALRSEWKTLETQIEGLNVQRVEAQKQLDEIVAEIQKTAELTPELREHAREEILRVIFAEELEKKRQSVELERLRQTGEISFDEYVARKRELAQ